MKFLALKMSNLFLRRTLGTATEAEMVEIELELSESVSVVEVTVVSVSSPLSLTFDTSEANLALNRLSKSRVLLSTCSSSSDDVELPLSLVKLSVSFQVIWQSPEILSKLRTLIRTRFYLYNLHNLCSPTSVRYYLVEATGRRSFS